MTSYTDNDGDLHDEDGHVITEVRHVSSATFTIRPRSDYDDWTINIPCLLCGSVCAGPDSPPVPVSYAVVALEDGRIDRPEGNYAGPLRDSFGLVCKPCTETNRLSALWELAEALSSLDDALMGAPDPVTAATLLSIASHRTSEIIADHQRHAARPDYWQQQAEGEREASE